MFPLDVDLYPQINGKRHKQNSNPSNVNEVGEREEIEAENVHWHADI
jgi:hypothetical protein